MREYASRRGWRIALQVKEIGSDAIRRERRETLLQAARRREIDVVLVWRLDRWGRSVTDLLATLQELEHLGVGFVSLTEALDLTTPAGPSDGWTAGCFCRVRARDSPGTGTGRLGAGTPERPTVGTAHNGGAEGWRGQATHRHGISKAEIARRLEIGRTSVRRILKERIQP
jgi:DNA invertase Pin-like site-specific DNA recombinase